MVVRHTGLCQPDIVACSSFSQTRTLLSPSFERLCTVGAMYRASSKRAGRPADLRGRASGSVLGEARGQRASQDLASDLRVTFP
eukprot:6558701-Alexandrium_andersonii.AAC.1